MNKGSHGFTLIEMLVVIIILGILAAIAVPIYIGTTERARAAEAIQQMGALGTDVQMNIQQGTSMAGWTIANLGYTVNDGGSAWAPNNATTAIGSRFNYTFAGGTTIITATKRNAPAGTARSVGTIIWYNVANANWGGTHPGSPQGVQ